MLKCCLDCIFGNTRDQANNEVIYHTQVNGHSQEAPPWPQPRNESEIMFVLPRKLNIGDKISIGGVLKANPKEMAINLIAGNTSPDYQNIACRFEAIFPNDVNNENRIIIKVIHNGYEEILKGNYEEHLATDLFPEADFTFGFTLRIPNSNYGDIPIMNLYVSGEYVHQYQIKHDLSDIRYLMLSGDVEKVQKLDFDFS